MQKARTLLPDHATLTAGLTCALRRNGADHAQLTVVGREPLPYPATFPSEIVRCRLEDGTILGLFCKYSAGHSHNAHGHRAGIAYEAEVYRQVLQPAGVSVPTFYGAHTVPATGETWLMLEYLEDCVRVNKSEEPDAMALAARWLGRFHAVTHGCLKQLATRLLIAYDAAYYRGWIQRTARYAGHWHGRFPWLTSLCQRAEDVIGLLLAQPLTVIHGEYYPKNVLLRHGGIYPVDWESAAAAVGEIDLASLTEGWPIEVTQECERAYRQARWPLGSPPEFPQTLDAARLYLVFRWLGDRHQWTRHADAAESFEQLRVVGERLGLL